LHWWRYSVDRDSPEDLGSADVTVEDAKGGTVDPSGRYLLDSKSTGIYLFPLDSLETAPPILVGHHERDVFGTCFDESGNLIISADKMGEIRIWSRQEDGGYELVMRHQTEDTVIVLFGFDRSASRVVYLSKGSTQVALMNRARPDTQPTLFLPEGFFGQPSLFPDGSWIVINNGADPRVQVYFYPLGKRRPEVWRVCPAEPKLWPQCFLGDGSRLVAWRLPELWNCEVFGAEPDCRRLWQHPRGRGIMWVGSDPLGRFLVAGSIFAGEAYLIPLDGSPPRVLGGFQGAVSAVALSPDARRAAAGGSDTTSGQGVIRIWDLEGEVQTIEAGPIGDFSGIWFLSEERLVSSNAKGLFLWNLTTGEHEILSEQEGMMFPNPTPAGGFSQCRCLDAKRRYLVVNGGAARGTTLWDLEERTERPLPIPADAVNSLAISADGRFVVAGMDDGEVMVLPLDANEPHLLLGHEGAVTAVWISPECDRIMSAGEDGTVRVWDVPAGPPQQTLPRKEFMALLRAQTNIRVVTDAKAENGYRTEFDRFPGWMTAPAW